MDNKLVFRTLRADEIEVRVGQCRDSVASLLLYKNARVDMDILDETVGPLNWDRHHYECKGNLFCRVGVRTSEDEDFVWKSDCGTESFTEKEKGEASDSFKRACVNWGIGRELYTAPYIAVKNSIGCTIKRNEKGKNVCYDKFSVREIKCENKKIVKLVIYNASLRKVVYEYGKPDREAYDVPTVAPAEDSILLCTDCGNPISVQEHDYSARKFGRQLCRDCQKRYRR